MPLARLPAVLFWLAIRKSLQSIVTLCASTVSAAPDVMPVPRCLFRHQVPWVVIVAGSAVMSFAERGLI